MAQTTAEMSGVNAQIEVSSDGAAWTDVSGSANKVDPGDQSRMTAEDYTFDGDQALITRGKLEPMEISVQAIYTETAGEAFEFLRALHETTGGSDCYVRWSPGGGNSGDYLFTSLKGQLATFQYPAAEAGEAAPILVEFTVIVPSVTQSAIA